MGKYAALILLAFTLPAASAGTGGEAMSFLKIDAGARAAALGGAYTAVGDDALSVFYNPAGTALAARSELVLSHSEWIEGLRHENLAYVQPLGRTYTVFGGANALLSGAMDKLDASGAKTGTFNSFDSAFSAGMSAAFGGGVYGGLAVKGLFEKADTESAYSWAGDAGLLDLYEQYRFGLSASNFGGSVKLGSTAFNLPLMLRAGAARQIGQQLWVMADWTKAGASAGTFGGGAEAEFEINREESFFVRAGYRSGRDSSAGGGFTCGAGLRNQDLRLDYAFTPYGDLGTAHRFTLSFCFGGSRSEFAQKASGPRVITAPDKTKSIEGRKKQTDAEKAAARRDSFTW